MDDTKFLRRAVKKAIEGVRQGQSPFGACIVRHDTVVACEHNTVWKTTDITAHAEVVAIRAACQQLKKIDLSDCVLFSTCEPCPMCLSAIHWAGIYRIVYGATIGDARKVGFRELSIPCRNMKKLGGASLKIKGPFLRNEALKVFQAFQQRPSPPLY